ncbi:MAG: hypothetical protein HUN04_03115 [Desulfobacter sp.]|nr:MAG: hypothetical protein HUN04_03115 [Desulfobacter sp.]
MKSVIMALTLCIITAAFTGAAASASTYYIWDDWGGSWSDAEKSPLSSEDDLMCWAATAANILAWTGWGDVVGDADDIFEYYQAHWTDVGGNAYFAWEWWFDGENEMQGESGWSQVDVPGGGFWAATYSLDDYVFSTFESSVDALAMRNIEYSLTQGYATALGLADGGTGGHSVTCWGYEYDADGNYLGIWITDSDDDKGDETPEDELVYYAVNSENGLWYLADFYGTDHWYITEVQGLSSMPAAVPLPSAMLLFGGGLAMLALAKRK